MLIVFLLSEFISIHAPRTGSDAQRVPNVNYAILISIHAPRTGSDMHRACRNPPMINFNPRSPHGERQRIADFLILPHISIHAPRTGSDNPAANAREQQTGISIHAPRTGSDTADWGGRTVHADFNPRSPHGERHRRNLRRHRKSLFQSTLPARGATRPRMPV